MCVCVCVCVCVCGAPQPLKQFAWAVLSSVCGGHDSQHGARNAGPCGAWWPASRRASSPAEVAAAARLAVAVNQTERRRLSEAARAALVWSGTGYDRAMVSNSSARGLDDKDSEAVIEAMLARAGGDRVVVHAAGDGNSPSISDESAALHDWRTFLAAVGKPWSRLRESAAAPVKGGGVPPPSRPREASNNVRRP